MSANRRSERNGEAFLNILTIIFFGGFCFVLRNGGEDDEVAAMATFDFEEV